MEGRDRYQVDLEENLIKNYQTMISVFYLPLIGMKAQALYLLLYSEKKNNMTCTLERLCDLTSLAIDELEEAIVALEKFELLRTFHKNGEYLFLLRSPLSVRQFMNHEVYSRLYLDKVGSEQFALSKAIYYPPQVIREGYEEETHGFDLSLMALWNQQDEDNYQQLKSEPLIADVKIDFDYEKFLRDTTNLVFPVSLRTTENMDAIGKLATMFAIPPERMRQLVARSIDKTHTVLDLQLLRNKCLREKQVEYKEATNPYEVNPVSFLYKRQQAAVSAADKKMLENLQVEYQLKPEVVNVLIEYALDNANNRLDRNYLEKIAATFLRQGVDSIDKAKQALAARPSADKKSSKPVFKASEMEVEEQDIEELRRKLFGKGKQ